MKAYRRLARQDRENILLDIILAGFVAVAALVSVI